MVVKYHEHVGLCSFVNKISWEPYIKALQIHKVLRVHSGFFYNSLDLFQNPSAYYNDNGELEDLIPLYSKTYTNMWTRSVLRS